MWGARTDPEINPTVACDGVPDGLKPYGGAPRRRCMGPVELTPADAAAVTDLYRDHQWWADRSGGAVRNALAATDLAVGVEDDGRLVAAARVLTDWTFYATVYDVIVAADRRGEGFGARLMEAVVDHERLADVATVDLRCREGLVPFYEQFGFAVHDPTVDADGREESFVKMNYEG